MSDDERSCGTGHCILDAQGRCWCGQQWDGAKMGSPAREGEKSDVPAGRGAMHDLQLNSDLAQRCVVDSNALPWLASPSPLVQRHYPQGSWLRSPHSSQHQPFSREGCLIPVKTGHLRDV